jgi:cytochrome c oxidase subunit III
MDVGNNYRRVFFVGSQAWEWGHFIHGTDFGKVYLSDGSTAVVKGEFGTIESFEVLTQGAHSPAVGELITMTILIKKRVT